ncbi:MAG: tetratricopeptide repeat protein [Bacteroidales bacterium]
MKAQCCDTLWQQANIFYTQGKFAEATDLFEEIEKKGICNALLFYNMGNSFFKQNEIAKSILYYERALRLAPHDEDTQYNLARSNDQIVDKIEPLPEFFVVSWIKSFRKLISIDAWAIIGITLFTVVLSLCLITFFLNFSHKKILLFIAIISLLVSCLSTTIAFYEYKEFSNHTAAIVSSPVTSVKASPTSGGIDLFILHEGTKVFIMEVISEWVKIKTADGNQGWIIANALEVI